MKKENLIEYDYTGIIELIIVISVCICGIIFVYFFSQNNKEEECVKYYTSNNGYILESCKYYEDKLKDVKIIEKEIAE